MPDPEAVNASTEIVPDGQGGYLWNPTETFTEAELEHATDLRQRCRPTLRKETGQFDRCPHTPACEDVLICIERIAWFVRHWRELPGVLE